MLRRKKNYKILIGLVIGIFISITTVYAATYLGSGSDLTYDNSSSGLDATTAQDAIDELYEYKKCPKKFLCIKKKDTLALGDYVSMTPTKSSYTTDTSKTGYDSTQTINPQELNLWRVISLNSDGSVDVISEYVSSTQIYFKGQTGYLNLVGYLNVLASQYENSTYTKGSRHFGYNGQTEYITDTSKFTATTVPWNCSTGESCNPVESQGGGDVLYQKDYDLVKSVLGTLLAIRPDSISETDRYLTASRYYDSKGNDYMCGGRFVDLMETYNSGNYAYLWTPGNTDFFKSTGSIRPVLTLKSGLKYSGLGTESYPMEISIS